VGGSRWSSDPRPRRFGRKEPERKGGWRHPNRSPERRKALKGEAPECRELKEAFRGGREADTAERVVKP
jgi:hypothetical protein